MAGIYNYNWYMSVSFDQWVKSGNWIIKSMQGDIKTGALTKAQWDDIWKRRDGLYQAKIDGAISKGTSVDLGPGGSATVKDWSATGNLWSLLFKNGEDIGGGLKQGTANVGQAINSAAAATKNGIANVANSIKSASNGGKVALIGAGALLFIILIFRRR